MGFSKNNILENKDESALTCIWAEGLWPGPMLLLPLAMIVSHEEKELLNLFISLLSIHFRSFCPNDLSSPCFSLWSILPELVRTKSINASARGGIVVGDI